MPKTKVIVLMGGNSNEREVSLKSGLQVLKNLDKNKYKVLPAIVSHDNQRWFLTNQIELEKLTSGENFPKSSQNKLITIDDGSENTVVFIAMHGKDGEDGKIQAFLELLNIPYTGSGVLASAIGMDKVMFKKVMRSENIITPSWTSSPKDKNIKFPCVVKPVSSGSSVGITIAHNTKELRSAVNKANKFDKNILIEEYIKGTEVSCGVLGNNKPIALPVIEIRPKKDFFDYEAKYEGKSEEICPAELPDKVSKKVQRVALQVFKAIGARGFSRIDMIIKNNTPYVLEINTIPGLTPQSLLPQEAAAAGITYSQLLDKMISLALEKTTSI